MSTNYRLEYADLGTPAAGNSSHRSGSVVPSTAVVDKFPVVNPLCPAREEVLVMLDDVLFNRSFAPSFAYELVNSDKLC